MDSGERGVVTFPIDAKSISVRVGDEIHCVQVPADPESAMQSSWDAHAEQDEYFPFWLEAWPSSYGLFDYLKQKNICVEGALEIGCGCGVLAQLLANWPGAVYHTDLLPAACAFSRCAVGNPYRHFFSMDISKPCTMRAPSLVLGADLFYEYSLVRMICAYVQHNLAPNGLAIFADPDRPSRPEVAKHIVESGVAFERIPWSYQLNGERKNLSVWLLRPSSNPLG